MPTNDGIVKVPSKCEKMIFRILLQNVEKLTFMMQILGIFLLLNVDFTIFFNLLQNVEMITF